MRAIASQLHIAVIPFQVDAGLGWLAHGSVDIAMKVNRIVADWPGKSDASGAQHPALWHMLDVAAVAQAILPLGRLGELPIDWQNAFLFLIALHDCGKLSTSFRGQIEKGHSPAPHNRHWELSFRMLMQHDAQIEQVLGGEAAAREILYAAVAGHHGKPPAWHHGQDAAIGPEGFAAGAEAIRRLAPLFAPANLGGLEEAQAVRLSWLLSGITVQADWVGSNEIWFPFAGPTESIATYWRATRQRAKVAIAQAGLSGAIPAAVDVEGLVGHALRPMQKAVADVNLPDSPILAIIEDATGAGKTEAALILAQRMVAAGRAQGVYFALPTMATAEAMFERMRPLLAKFFDGTPSLALLHGRRLLSEGFRAVKGNQGLNPNDAGCAAWIADDRRRSLLADIGVGTIDQALMSVLPTRFNTLRMAALANRILIVDEAHSYDPYMERELQTLMRFHSAFGGSAILMTATLPEEMRTGLIEAWLKSDRRGRKQIALPDLTTAYPALSLLGATSSSVSVPSVPATCRKVAVEMLPDAAAAIATIREGQARGGACLWVRNAVDDAIAAVDALRAEGIDAELLHARFAMCDRLSVERRLTERFGRDGSDRRGRVLVATQVVEMSLDLDFDVMVSDLAPIGSLVQRAGRLWRHMDKRPSAERPVPGPIMHVLMPDPDVVADARWLHDVLDAGAWVYSHDHQWRTARALKDAGSIDAPRGLRALIAMVHGEGAPAVPAPLEQAELERIGRQSAERGLARQHLLNPLHAYGSMENSFADEKFPTRLGEDQMTLILVRADGQRGLLPWSDDPDPSRALALSEVQIALRKYQPLPLAAMQSRLDIVAFTASWKEWEHTVKAVAVVAPDGTICDGLRYEADRGLLISY